MSSVDVAEATQAALAAEHAAVYGYGVVGGLIGEERAGEAQEAHTAHRARRDALARTLRRLGATPVASAAAYELPFAVTDATGAARLAAEVELRLAGAYADLVLVTTGEERRTAAGALSEAAVRAARWSGEGVAFPGLAEYANAGGR
ncbi:ferritin-like domain-containing protein [Streptomyces sp. 4N509B]|uniref:ferritin-like domain-containing protein n=1 Tax=Streptomyces sp. 4N509B TaxID=3457413 RepID=UPI003FD54227